MQSLGDYGQRAGIADEGSGRMADGQSVVADALHRESRPGERRKMRERELLERFVNGNDQAAFRALIDRHGPMVLGVCRSLLKEPHDAEDAFQNIFLILARRAGTIKHRDSIGPWLHRVAVRVATRARVKANDRRARERRGFRSKAEPTCDDYVRILLANSSGASGAGDFD